MCQHNSFLIFHSMNERSLTRWRHVTLITTTVAFLFAVTYALTGYLVFGQHTEGICFPNENFFFPISNNLSSVLF